ncbi:MAG: PE-PPE domain-containing protein [Mycobacteriaceae bacterium]
MTGTSGALQGAHIGGVINTATIRAGLGVFTAAVGFGIFAMYGPATANADTVLMVGGADVQAFPGAQNGVYMPAILGGYLCKSGSGNECLVAPFSGAAGVLTPNNPQPLDASVSSAADRLAEQIKQTPGPKIAVGYSAGASVVEEAAERLSKDPNGPPADELSLITVGNIDDGLSQMVPPGTYLQSIGYTVRQPVQTKYRKTVVTDRYDGLAHSTINPVSHPLAALNSVSGTAYSHLAYFNPDINLADPSYLVSQDGNVRHLVLPDQIDLPVKQALRDMGQPAIADAAIGPTRDENNAYPLSPWLVDQLISAAAPTFVSQLNNDKDRLVETLLPVLAEHPEMFDNVPIFAPQGTAIPTTPNNAPTQTNDTTGVTPSP